MTAQSKLFIDQGRTTLYQLFRYIDQYRFNYVFTPLDCYNIHHTTNVTALSSVKSMIGLKCVFKIGTTFWRFDNQHVLVHDIICWCI